MKKILRRGKWCEADKYSSIFNVVIHKWSLCEKFPNKEFFLVRIFPYTVIIRENTGQKNSVFGHFSRSCRFAIN